VKRESYTVSKTRIRTMTDRDENDWMDGYYGSRAIEAEHAKEVAGLRDAIAQLKAYNARLTRERDLWQHRAYTVRELVQRAEDERDQAMRMVVAALCGFDPVCGSALNGSGAQYRDLPIERKRYVADALWEPGTGARLFPEPTVQTVTDRSGNGADLTQHCEPPGDPMAGRVAVEHANGLWKRATGCAEPAEAQSLISKLNAEIERLRSAPSVAISSDIELLRRCYRAMLLGQHDQAGQLDSAAMALAEAYPEVTK
jgi:hypothetical protein